ncbi:MAG: Hsp33 family molecular chaperone HslO [Bacillota bacterium]
MEDYLIRVMTTNKEIRALAVNATNTVEKARNLHNTTAVATAALGRGLAGGALISSLVKSGEETSLIIRGNGPLKKIVVEGNQKGEVRGYVGNPNVPLNLNNSKKLDIASAIGKGELVIRKNYFMKEPYEGRVKLISGEIGDDLSYYFTKSEQTPSSVGLGVLVDKDQSVKAAGGFIIQLLPDPSDETIDQLEENISKVNSLSKLIDKGKKPEGLLDILLEGFDYRVMAKKDVKFKCSCNREQIKAIMTSLGKKELKETLKQEGKVEIKCHFCNSKYQFDEKEVNKIIEENKQEG